MNTKEYLITEEWMGYYHYHISLKDSFTKPICGKDITTMQTAIPFDTWGFVGDLKERYCDKCYKIYGGSRQNG